MSNVLPLNNLGANLPSAALEELRVALGLPQPTYDGKPVNAVKAHLTVNPAGANNSIDYTAVAFGEAGEAVSIGYTAPEQAALEVSVDGQAITVACGTKHRMVVTGTLDPNAAGDLISAGEVNSHKVWSTDGTTNPAAVGAWVMLNLQLDGTVVLEHWTNGNKDGFWTSSDTGDWPDGLTYFADAPATGTATVTAALPTAQQVLDAVEASTEATALVTVAANGMVTGAVAAVTAAHLAGAVDGTPGSLGRTAIGFETGETTAKSIWTAMTENNSTTQNGWLKTTSGS